LEGCVTCGDDLLDGYEMAEDILAIKLFDYESESRSIPSASDYASIKLKKGSFVTYVMCDTIVYQKKHNSKVVKKTLTIPGWMDDLATRKGLNFSKLLRDALSKEFEPEQ
jgi:hypothetical protein